ncbi:uncharacterized protein CLUP02_10290 [Colletotrichum lupini]|uniref:Uncharacterized protein n=1 Tax=Colletotrichum lupini TaxID=145971 RepID=A0A9Q8SWC3_9PEZI|nr:uncharacterized protein CLUP02_10290 [Colletotrichum lupini]UQC84794.1 hypothetical protein CLUP02_10290 [Colletotrichum lupini]
MFLPIASSLAQASQAAHPHTSCPFPSPPVDLTFLHHYLDPGVRTQACPMQQPRAAGVLDLDPHGPAFLPLSFSLSLNFCTAPLTLFFCVDDHH